MENVLGETFETINQVPLRGLPQNGVQDLERRVSFLKENLLQKILNIFLSSLQLSAALLQRPGGRGGAGGSGFRGRGGRGGRGGYHGGNRRGGRGGFRGGFRPRGKGKKT